MRYARLTQEQIDRICELREEGLSYPKIAAIVGCSRGAVEWQCLKLGAEPPEPVKASPVGPMVVERNGRPVRRFTPEEDERLLRLARSGMTYAAIGRAMGRRHHSVLSRLMVLARRDERAAPRNYAYRINPFDGAMTP
ncbi:helix-turn-helix domain-containing protein [Brevundimonas sp.]|uniref:helix-turn-helix domain-containing protein n=1 Tax=Brevundimonas sp. TaxID=1871086 RepID=UPI002D631D21|nr:helix-turn-helix domain-containing protein [Brevundimonas sp.]HYD29221.1 helix-turn-helix domain-containing protein [Brevundimonas sp.]